MTQIVQKTAINGGRPALLGGSPAFPEKLPLMRPSIPTMEELTPVLAELQASRFISNFGPYSQKLEEAIARRLGVEHCLALSNLSTGLMYMPAAAQLDGGEVIVPSFTFVATAHSMKLGGLEPVFADIDPDTLTLDPRSVAEAITPRTVAVCAVHLYGTPCDIKGLQEVCDRFGLKLFFDSAHALGSKYQGMPVGGFGLAEGFSTSVTKIVSTLGEGGFICTNDAGVAERIRLMRNWGHSGDYNSSIVSICGKLPEFSAATGLLEFERLDSYLDARTRSVERFRSQLTQIPGIRFPLVRKGDVSSFKDMAILINAREFGMTSQVLQKALKAEGVETRRYFSPSLHVMDCYRSGNNARRVPLNNTNKASAEVICLPLSNSTELETIDRLCDCINDLYKNAHNICRKVQD